MNYMSSITRWLRRKWAEIRGDRLTILNHLSVASSGLFVTTEQLPYSTTLRVRQPLSPTGEWRFEWRWVTPPPDGVLLDPRNSAYTKLEISANAAPGAISRLECVGWCDGVEWRSAPYAVQILKPVDGA